MKYLLLGIVLTITGFITYKLIDDLIIRATANDEVEAPSDYFKEVKS